MIAFKYHFVILLITIIRVRSASIIRHEPARETIVDYVYEIRDDPVAPVDEETEVVAPGEDYDWKKYQEQELIFAPGSGDELRVRPDGTATFTQPEVKRIHRTTANGDDYYVYEYWYPAEEDLANNGLGKYLAMDRNDRGRASGNLAEDPSKPDNSKLIKETTTTTTAQPERVKRAEDIGTTLSPKPQVAAGQQSGAQTTIIPVADAKLAVVVQSDKDTAILNKQASGSSSDQEKSTTNSPTTSPAPVKLVENNSPTETVKTKKSVNAPAILVESSSLDVSDASDKIFDKGAESKNAKLVIKLSPVEQTNVAPAATANDLTEKAAQDTPTTIPDINVAVAPASEVESKKQTKRHEAVLTTSTEPQFEEVEDLKTTTPKTIVVARSNGDEIVAEVVPNDSGSGKQVEMTLLVKKAKSEFAPAQTAEEVTVAPKPITITATYKDTAVAKAMMMAESQQSEVTTPPSIPSMEKSAVAPAAAAELPILRFGFPEISRREFKAANQADAEVPIVKRETGKLKSTHQMEAEVTLVDSEDIEDAAANTIALEEPVSTVAPAKQEEKEDSAEEQAEEEDQDQAPASKVSNIAASHVEEDVVEGAPTDQDSKDSLSKLVKKQTSSHGKHFKGEEVEAEEENMAPANKVGEDSGEEEEDVTTLPIPEGTTPATVTAKQDSPEEEEETTVEAETTTENDEEDEDDEETKDTEKREDSESTQELVDDVPKNVAEGLSLLKALSKRGDSGGGAGIEGGGIADGGDVNQIESSKSKALLTDMSPGKIVKSASDEGEDDEEDGGSDGKNDEEDDEDDKSESPGESTFTHHGKHSTGRKRREISDEKFVAEGHFDKATVDNPLLHRNKRSVEMRERVVDGEKVYVDTPLEFDAPGSNFDGIADGRHLLMNGVPRLTRQTGSGYDAFPQTVGSDKFPHPFCDLERDTGIICPGVRRGVFLEQFFYDSETNRCSHFVYNGCGGNANRFSTLWECNQFCGKQTIHTKRQD